jgi:hypothetical protein
MSGKTIHHCPNCRASLIAPRLARYINERCVSNYWSCETCGHEHETSALVPHSRGHSLAYPEKPPPF